MKVKLLNQLVDLELGSKIKLRFNYNKKLISEIKDSMDKPRWDPDSKCWIISNNLRNHFVLRYLMSFSDPSKDPYQIYDKELVPYTPKRPLRPYQVEMVRHILTRKNLLLASEMGTGKSLVIIEVLDHLQEPAWWVAPKSGLVAVKLELKKWNLNLGVQLMTYEAMVKAQNDKNLPKIIIFDESHKLKTHNTNRTKAAMTLVERMRDNGDCYIILMSGSPAPKSPLDWWSQCEIAQPGYLKEGDIYRFKRRLAVLRKQQSLIGATFDQIVCWRDGSKKCNVCGDPIELHAQDHVYEPMVNEIEKLYSRMKGLVLVKFKKDCIDLPEKVYIRHKCQTTPEIIKMAKVIAAQSPTAIERITKLRELSDGFQYVEEKSKIPCCENKECSNCYGSGYTVKFDRKVKFYGSPKLEALEDLIENLNRVVVYAGFTASIDMLVEHVKKLNWEVIVVDGRGWRSTLAKDKTRMLEIFQDKTDSRNIMFIGHPASAGVGITLTASETIIYYSNDFNADSRIQSEDRIHRIGSTGATIIDLIHLPTDELILDNLKQKRDLQSITLGEITNCMGA